MSGLVHFAKWAASMSAPQDRRSKKEAEEDGSVGRRSCIEAKGHPDDEQPKDQLVGSDGCQESTACTGPMV